MKTTFLTAFAVAFMAFAAEAYAHGGDTDANGCHTNHKTGEYHCH
ncbi:MULTISPECIES: YHYH domain-containing protein [unclassified Mesorhizobium]